MGSVSRSGEDSKNIKESEDELFRETILVVLDAESSMNKLEYTTEDFPELNLECVVDLTAGTFALVQRQLEAEQTGI